MNKVMEIFGYDTASTPRKAWNKIVRDQTCPFSRRKCFKVRKSQPEISIGTCVLSHGVGQEPVITCPWRFLERRQIFTDALHLLSQHEPGNELHVVKEMAIPGGSVDYFLVSVTKGKPVDFVGLEIQALDTTGTAWPARENFLSSCGVRADKRAVNSGKTFGINWKMTGKTTLVQLHHKINTFEHLSKHMVLILQDCLLDYIRREFSFNHIRSTRQGDPMHFHSYSCLPAKKGLRIELGERLSTDSSGISQALGLQATSRIELATILHELERKISRETLLTFG